jgi:hypothetical protein
MRHMRFVALSLVLACLGASSAWADEPSTTTPPKPDASQTKSADAAQAKQIAAAKKADAGKTAANTSKDRPDCIKSTGSRIPARPGECLSEPGHSWSRDEVDSTGKNTAGGALRQMDPLLH